jgi:hypothetical protein
MHTTSKITLACDRCRRTSDYTIDLRKLNGEQATDVVDEEWVKDRGRIVDGRHECKDCAWRLDNNYFQISYAKCGEDLAIVALVYEPNDFSNISVLFDAQWTGTRSKDFPKLLAQRIPKSWFETLRDCLKIPEIKVVRRVQICTSDDWVENPTEYPHVENDDNKNNFKLFDPEKSTRNYNSNPVLDLAPAIAMFERGEIAQPTTKQIRKRTA